MSCNDRIALATLGGWLAATGVPVGTFSTPVSERQRHGEPVNQEPENRESFDARLAQRSFLAAVWATGKSHELAVAWRPLSGSAASLSGGLRPTFSVLWVMAMTDNGLAAMAMATIRVRIGFPCVFDAVWRRCPGVPPAGTVDLGSWRRVAAGSNGQGRGVFDQRFCPRFYRASLTPGAAYRGGFAGPCSRVKNRT